MSMQPLFHQLCKQTKALLALELIKKNSFLPGQLIRPMSRRSPFNLPHRPYMNSAEDNLLMVPIAEYHYYFRNKLR